MKRTLAEWSAESGILPTSPTTETGMVSLVIDHYNPKRPELWRLSDYIVSNIAGAVIWLAPVRERVEECIVETC